MDPVLHATLDPYMRHYTPLYSWLSMVLMRTVCGLFCCCCFSALFVFLGGGQVGQSSERAAPAPTGARCRCTVVSVFKSYQVCTHSTQKFVRGVGAYRLTIKHSGSGQLIRILDRARGMQPVQISVGWRDRRLVGRTHAH